MSALISFVASALLIQTVYGQYINNFIAQSAVGGCGCGNDLNLASNRLGYGGLGYGSGLNLASNGLGYGGLGYSTVLPGAAGSAGALFVSSRSATTPNGLSLLGDNLELGGEVEVLGAYPFVTAVGVNGVLPSVGDATVSYSSTPGIGLASAGCGLALPGSSLAGAGLVNGGSYGIYGNNIGANYAGISGRCGSGY